MCLAIQQMRESSMAAGRAEGKAAGIAEGRLKAYAEMVFDGTITAEIAARKLNMTVEEFVKKADMKPQMN